MSIKLLFLAFFIAVASAQLPDLSGLTGGLPDTSGLTGSLPVEVPIGGGGGEEGSEGATTEGDAFKVISNRFNRRFKNKN